MLAYNRAITSVWILEQIPVESLESVEWLSRNRWSSGEMCCLTRPCQGSRPWTERNLAKLSSLPNPYNGHGEVLGCGVFAAAPSESIWPAWPSFSVLCLSFSSFPRCSKSCLWDLEGQEALRSRAGIFPQVLCEFLNMWLLSYMRWKTMATYWLFYSY